MTRRINYRLEAKNCLDGMQELAAESVDVVITSPPYNLPLQECSGGFSLGRSALSGSEGLIP